jgi:ParB family transcriptional regulator, chromosome partitioning protein
MMSKADELGASPSFSAAQRPRSERRRMIEGATGDEREAPHAAAAPPRIVALTDLAHNPYNPRHELRDLQETADSLLEKGQIQPITVVTRSAFLQAHPGQEAAIGSALYVVLDGNRRLGAARLAGIEDLRMDVNDPLATSAADMLESALIANIHREDLTPLEEAETLAELMKVYESQRQVARRIGKSHVWVSQRLALLELTPELQEDLGTGALTVEDGRRIGKLPKPRQAEAAEEAKAERKKPRARGQGGNAVNTRAESAGAREGGNGVNSAGGTVTAAPPVDWSDPAAIAEVLKQRLDPGQLKVLTELLLQSD